jgi:hypothetical protein
MHPLLVDGPETGLPERIKVFGRTPHDFIASEDVLPRNVIRSFHDMYYVRAGLAYVDGNSTFLFYDITNDDISSGTLLSAAAASRSYRVEGIAAVSFETDANGVTVWVIAEGDNAVTGRQNIAGAPSQAFRDEARWGDVVFDPERYYEEFSMRWRSRNVEFNGP